MEAQRHAEEQPSGPREMLEEEYRPRDLRYLGATNDHGAVSSRTAEEYVLRSAEVVQPSTLLSSGDQVLLASPLSFAPESGNEEIMPAAHHQSVEQNLRRYHAEGPLRHSEWLRGRHHAEQGGVPTSSFVADNNRSLSSPVTGAASYGRGSGPGGSPLVGTLNLQGIGPLRAGDGQPTLEFMGRQLSPVTTRREEPSCVLLHNVADISLAAYLPGDMERGGTPASSAVAGNLKTPAFPVLTAAGGRCSTTPPGEQASSSQSQDTTSKKPGHNRRTPPPGDPGGVDSGGVVDRTRTRAEVGSNSSMNFLTFFLSLP